ncbi:alpha/beta hydrolase [Actinomycetospora aeridis]|uniref:Alpha/beta hydrolase n=1 Tax=Actinomycetospora aeridis TaxID=3129231 RepID=A0ABU8MY64_9PSEU
MTPTGTTTDAGRRAPAVAALVLLALGALVLLAAAVTALLPGTALFGTEVSKRLVVVDGPRLVLLGIVVTAAAWWLRRSRLLARALTTTVAVVATVATLVLTGAVGAVVTATLAAGGSVDPWRALTLAGPPDGSAPDARAVYSTTPQGQDLHLAITRPRDTARPAPVFVWVHGGGWATGSELDRAADLRRLADAGFLAVSVEYTLAAPGRPTWDVAGPQVACALARVAEHAAEQGGDPRRIVLGGDSAGGQLATSVGYRAASGSQPSACPSPVPVPVPRAIATLYPAVDLDDTYRAGQGAQEFAVGYTGGTPDQVPERYRAVEGIDALTRAAPPTLAVVPARDHLVPPGGATRFVEAARAAGVDAEQVDIPFADHAFDTGPDGSLGHQAASTVLAQWVREQAVR